MTIMLYEQSTALDTAAAMGAAGQAANEAAAKHAFADYISRKAKSTVKAQGSDLALFAEFLAAVGVSVDGGRLQEDPAAWKGVTWGLVAGFVKWQLQAGHAVGSINRKLSTVKVYAKLASQAGAISAQERMLIQGVSGYSQKEAIRVDAERTKTRVSTKKAVSTSISDEQAKALKTHPDTPQGRRDAVLMCLLLDHGLRAGEVALLTVANVDLKRGMLVDFYRPKVSITQNNELHSDTFKALRAYFDSGDAPAIGLLLRGSRKGGQLTGAGMNTGSISDRVRALGAALGIENLSAHDCRHYWATFHARRKTSIDRLMQAGGWNSPAMPLRYIERSAIANEGMV